MKERKRHVNRWTCNIAVTFSCVLCVVHAGLVCSVPLEPECPTFHTSQEAHGAQTTLQKLGWAAKYRFHWNFVKCEASRISDNLVMQLILPHLQDLLAGGSRLFLLLHIFLHLHAAQIFFVVAIT